MNLLRRLRTALRRSPATLTDRHGHLWDRDLYGGYTRRDGLSWTTSWSPAQIEQRYGLADHPYPEQEDR